MKKIALLIDAENGVLPILDEVVERLSTLGQIVVARAYGDFSQVNLSLENWKSVCLKHNIGIAHHFICKKQKNSSDIFLCVDAMDILYTQAVDIFCIVSSDSDFSSLVQRLKNAGKEVIGFGSLPPNESYKQLFNHFSHLSTALEKIEENQPLESIEPLTIWQKDIEKLEILIEKLTDKPQSSTPLPQAKNLPLSEEKAAIKSAFGQCQSHLDKEGFVRLSRFQSYLGKEFIAKIKKEHKMLSKWVKNSDLFEIKNPSGKPEPLIKPKF